MSRREDKNRFQLIRELPLEELLFTAISLLIGEDGVDFAYYENDPGWWELRLLTRIN